MYILYTYISIILLKILSSPKHSLFFSEKGLHVETQTDFDVILCDTGVTQLSLWGVCLRAFKRPHFTQ